MIKKNYKPKNIPWTVEWDVIDKSAGDTSDIISDSSGVGTSNSDTTTCSLQTAGATVVCLQPYEPAAPGHLRLNQGDIIEGTAKKLNVHLVDLC